MPGSKRPRRHRQPQLEMPQRPPADDQVFPGAHDYETQEYAQSQWDQQGAEGHGVNHWQTAAPDRSHEPEMGWSEPYQQSQKEQWTETYQEQPSEEGRKPYAEQHLAYDDRGEHEYYPSDEYQGDTAAALPTSNGAGQPDGPHSEGGYEHEQGSGEQYEQPYDDQFGGNYEYTDERYDISEVQYALASSPNGPFEDNQYHNGEGGYQEEGDMYEPHRGGTAHKDQYEYEAAFPNDQYYSDAQAPVYPHGRHYDEQDEHYDDEQHECFSNKQDQYIDHGQDIPFDKGQQRHFSNEQARYTGNGQDNQFGYEQDHQFGYEQYSLPSQDGPDAEAVYYTETDAATRHSAPADAHADVYEEQYLTDQPASDFDDGGGDDKYTKIQSTDSDEDLQEYWDLANEIIDSDPIEEAPAQANAPPPQGAGRHRQQRVEQPSVTHTSSAHMSGSANQQQPHGAQTSGPPHRSLPVAQPVTRLAAPKVASKALGMTGLRDIIMIPEAKADPNRDRSIGTGENCQAVLDFFLDPKDAKASQQQQQTKSSTSTKPEAKGGTVPPAKAAPKQSTQVKVTAKSSSNPSKSSRPDPLKNPDWYALADPSSHSEGFRNELPILVGDRVNQCRPLLRALRYYDMNLIECDIQTQGADLALSPATAIIIRPLGSIVQDHAQLISDVKRAAFYFHRVIIVFEVVSYREIDKDPEADIEYPTPSDAVLAALAPLKRGLAVAIIPDRGQIIGTAEAVFARRGADEVAKVLRHLAEQDDLKISARCTPEARELWEAKDWLKVDVDPEQERLWRGAGFNLYSMRFLTAGFGSYDYLADQMKAEERSKVAGPVTGSDVIERFNTAHGRKLRKKSLLSTDPTSPNAET